jgi:isopenicillin N synthase-like dioxygenase
MVQVPVKTVTVNYKNLIDSGFDTTNSILEAFGPNGLGVILVSGVPEWDILTKSTIPLAHKLVNLGEETLHSLAHEPSLYNSGWSFGKEKLGDKPDFKKGSFYFNPLSDNPRPDIRDKYPWALPENRWPSKELPELEINCKKLGSRMHEVVVALAKRIDEMNLGTRIATELETSFKAKGRMLYYFPLSESELPDARARPDGWIGWHNDSGFLTGLTPDIYFDHASGKIVDNPEPEIAGLWVADRSGVLRKITIPPECMAIQCGECLQVITGGKLVATPHCVRPPLKNFGIARACMPVFVDSTPEFKLDSPNGNTSAVFLNTVKQWVPPLSERWHEGQTFADFLGSSFKAYYSWETRDVV